MGRPRKYDKNLPERMYKRGPSYYFSPYGTTRWINLGRDYVASMTKYASLTSHDGPCLCVGDLIDRYLAEIAAQKAPRTYRDNVIEARKLRAVFGEMLLSEVTTQHIYRYLDERGKQAKVRANREISLLAHMFKKAERWGDIAQIDNPCIRIEKHKEKPRNRYVSDAEYIAFKKHAGPLIAAYMDIKYATGLRQSDMLSLRLSDLKEDGIYVAASKTGKDNIIEWTESLRNAVGTARRLPRSVRGMHLFCNRRGQQYTGSGFRSIWHRKMRSALEKGVLLERFREHDLRGKSSSDVELEHATKLLGHSDSRFTQRVYRRKPERVQPVDRVLEE